MTVDASTGALIVMVTGAGPGLGKSTLAARLHHRIASVEPAAELFREEDILEHECFTDVISQFRSKGQADIETLLADARRYVDDLERRAVSVAVLDALFPYLSSLIAWDHSDDTITELFAGLGAAMASFRVIQLHLIGNAERGLIRASAREGDDWLARAISKTNAYPGCHATVTSVDDLVTYIEDAARRQSELLTLAPWPVIELDADLGAEALEAAAVDVTGRVKARVGVT